jgi:hypothetical protein
VHSAWRSGSGFGITGLGGFKDCNIRMVAAHTVEECGGLVSDGLEIYVLYMIATCGGIYQKAAYSHVDFACVASGDVGI